MGLIYISISISGFFVLYAFLISIGMINTKFVMTNYNKLLFISYSITTIFSIIGLFVYYSLFEEYYPIFLLFGGISVLYLILCLINHIFKIKKTQNISFNIKSGEYIVVSKIGFTDTALSIYSTKSVIKTTYRDKEIYIIFNSTSPELNKNLLLNCIKKNENTYICTSYCYNEKMKLKDIISILYNYYCILLITYGLNIVTEYYIKYGTDSKNPGGKFISIPFAFIIFKFGMLSTKNAKDSFTKFIHIFTVLLYYLLLIETLVIWFV